MENGDFDGMKEAFAKRAFSDAANGLPDEEQHWAPQVQILHNCGWEQFAPDLLDYRADLSVGNLSVQMHDILALVNATEQDHALVDEVFRRGKGSAHNNPLSLDYGAMYGRQDVIDAVKTIYQADFTMIPGIGRGFTDNLKPSRLTA
uniref:Uncharacterized protein n=1 Tax=Alexandrium andersonii TaxID=327968 RepID=A0A7S2DJH4_9DINO